MVAQARETPSLVLLWIHSGHRGAGRVFQKLVQFTTPMRPIERGLVIIPTLATQVFFISDR